MQQNPILQPDEIDDEFSLYAEDIAIKRAEEELLSPNQLLSKTALIEKHRRELLEEFQAFRKSQISGAKHLKCALEALGAKSPELFTDQVSSNIDRISNLGELIAQDVAYYRECMSKGMTLQAFAEVDAVTMDVLYRAARELLMQRRFEEAADVFSFLLSLNPHTFAFCLGLATCEFQQGHYREALRLYSAIYRAWPDRGEAYLAASRCFRALNDPQSAAQIVEEGLIALKDHPEYQKWKAVFTEENHLR